MSKIKAKGIVFSLLSGLCVSTAANAQTPQRSFRITGTTLATIDIKDSKSESKGKKTIGLLKIIPSEQFVKKQSVALEKFKSNEPEKDYSYGIVSFDKSQGAKDLGMNSVPVFDQGAYGTCVTFATTAAINAILNQGDFISQQCTLQLNRILGHDLWNGAYFPSQIIDPLKKYGLVKQGKGSAKEGKCNADYPNVFGLVTISGYKNRAENSGQNANNIKYRYFAFLSLDDVRKAINANHRMLVGFGLLSSQNLISTQGFDVTVNGTKAAGGLWACQQPGSQEVFCGRPNSGHEVVITGYDDEQQLLKMRNSWSSGVGDKGEFYMTYTYFETMVFDGTEIY